MARATQVWKRAAFGSPPRGILSLPHIHPHRHARRVRRARLPRLSQSAISDVNPVAEARAILRRAC